MKIETHTGKMASGVAAVASAAQQSALREAVRDDVVSSLSVFADGYYVEKITDDVITARIWPWGTNAAHSEQYWRIVRFHALHAL